MNDDPRVPGAWRPCLPSLRSHNSDSFLEAVALGGQHPRWLKTLERMRMCRSQNSPTWIGARDRLGQLESWMAPSACHERFHDGCRAVQVGDAIDGLEAERLAAGERGLAMATLCYPACEHEMCRLWAWWRCLNDAGRWRDSMRREAEVPSCRFECASELDIATWWADEVLYRDLEDDGRLVFIPEQVETPFRFRRDTTSFRIRAVTVLESHVSGWPHVHMVMRLLPRHTRKVTVHRKAKLVTREVAAGGELTRARRRWHAISGGWTAFWEVVAARPKYIAEYLGKLSTLEEDVKALVTAGSKRFHSRSREIPMPLTVDSRWTVYRGAKVDVAARLGVNREAPLTGHADTTRATLTEDAAYCRP